MSDNDTKASASQAWAGVNKTYNSAAALNPTGIANWNNATNQYFSSLINAGYTQNDISNLLRSMPADQASKLTSQGIDVAMAKVNPASWWQKGLQALSLATSVGALTAGVGAFAAAPAGLGLGSIASGTLAGASGGAASNLLTVGGKQGLAQSIGLGALGGAAGAAASPLTGAVSDATGLGSNISSALVKGGVGAATGALGGSIKGTGAGMGALVGGVGGAASSLVSSGAQGLGASNGFGNVIGKTLGGLAGGAAGNFLGSGGGQSGVQGNNGNMATNAGSSFMGINNPNLQVQASGTTPQSTDSTLASTITGALPSVLQGAAGIYGSQNAAEKQTQADQNAIGTQQSTLGNIGNIWSTQQNLGKGAQTALGPALGTNGQPADYSGFENMPGYQFAINQGTQAIQRQAAAMGNAYTPNTATAVGQYVTGTAMQDYNTYINQLMGAAGLGSTANAGIATPTYQTGTNISTLQQNQGQAQASGVSGAANAVGGLFGVNGAGTSLIGAAGRALTGGGSGGGVSSSPFAGTSLANNSGAFNAYNANNGPTAGDISASINDPNIGNINVGQIDPGSSFNDLNFSSGDMGGDFSGDYGMGDW